MSDWDMKLLASESQRLIAESARDPELRSELRALAMEILEATEASAPDSSAAEVETVPAARAGGGPDHPRPPREPLRELTLGRRPAAAVPPPSAARGSSRADSDEEDELEAMGARCRAKCDAVRWQAECHRRIWEGVEAPIEDAGLDPEMVAWAGRLVDCFYWLDDQDASGSTDISLLDDVAGCYEALAEVTRLVPRAEGRRGPLERALPMLAEAQSMLRRSLQRLQAPDDPDQLTVYRIIREAAARHRIYVRRHMRADDLADPAGWPGLLSRVEAIAASGQQSRQQKERIDRIRELLETIRRGAGSDEDWRTIVHIVDEAVGEGIPPSNRDFRDLLLPVIDDLPDRDDLPQGFRLVLREIDRFLATRTPLPKAASGYAPPAEVKEAARLVDGRSVVLIGGIRRQEAQAALKKALGLKELIWIETKEHQSIESFEPVIARPDVALVLLAIRWSSHAFGDVRQYCIQHDKPLVRLPGGYGPHQVAVQVLAQASESLAGR
jgi:hypothetical protein